MKTLTSSDTLKLGLRIAAMLVIGAGIGILPCVNVLSGVIASLIWILWENPPRSKTLVAGVLAGLLAGIGGLLFHSVTGLGYPASVISNIFVTLLMGGITGYLVSRRRPRITDVEAWKDRRRGVKYVIQALCYRGSDGDRPAWQIRREAASALGEIGNARAVNPLVQALTDDDDDDRVRMAAAESLNALAWRPTEDAAGANYWILNAQWEKCVSIGVPAVPPLIKTLNHRDSPVRLGAVKALAAIGDERATAPLLQVLGDSDREIDSDRKMRSAVGSALVKIDDPRVVEPLTELLDASSPPLRHTAVEVLGQIGDERAVEPLARMLTERALVWREPEMVAAALVKIGGERAWASLVAALGSRDLIVRKAASQALIWAGVPAVPILVTGLVDDDSDVRRSAGGILVTLLDDKGELSADSENDLSSDVDPSLLIDALDDSDLEVRQAAVALLTRMDWQPTDLDVQLRYHIAAQHWEALADLGMPAIEPLIAALDTGAWKTRQGAAEALGNIGDSQAVDALSMAIRDRSLQVRQTVVKSLGQIGGRKTVDPLIAALDDEDPRVRDAAIVSLVQTGDIAIDPLVAVLSSSQARVRKAAAEVLERLDWHPDTPELEAYNLIALQSWEACVALDTAAVIPFLAVLDDRNSEVREAAVRALGEIGDIRAVEPLVSALKDRERNDKWVRMSIARALQNIGGKRVMDAMLEVLEEDRDIFVVTSRVLNHEPRAVPSLIGYLKDKNPVVREYAAIALGSIGDTRAIEPLRVALQDDRRDDRGSAREVASKALQRLQEGQQGKPVPREADVEETQAEAIERASQWEHLVSFVRVDKRKVMTVNARGALEIERIYRVHQGPSRDAALSFLADHPVTRMHEYVIVETPEGNYGRDISGIFDEESGEPVAPELLKQFECGTIVIVVPPDLNRGFYLDATVQAVCIDDHREYEATFRNIAPDGKSIAAIFPKLPAGKTYRLQLPVPMPGLTPEVGAVSVRVKPAQVVELKPFD